MLTDVSTMVAGEHVLLLPERALWWPAARTLFVADAHLGKDATFRAHGVPLPTGTDADDLARLARALARTDAQHLVILGDWLHARDGHNSATYGAVQAWRDAHAAVRVTLVRGNHDRAAGDLPAAWRIAVVDALVCGPFLLRHDPFPPDAARGHLLSGHLHPGWRVGGARAGLVLPCFWLGGQAAVLPAFGAFTGVRVVRPAATDTIYVVAQDAVLRAI